MVLSASAINAQVLITDFLAGISVGNDIEAGEYIGTTEGGSNTFQQFKWMLTGRTGTYERGGVSPKVATPLSYNGYVAATENSVELKTSEGARNSIYGFTNYTTYKNKAFYLSFLFKPESVTFEETLKIIDFLSLDARYTSNIRRGIVYMVESESEGKVKFGLKHNRDDAAEEMAVTGDYPIGETILMVLKYDYINKKVQLFINPQISLTEPTIPTLEKAFETAFDQIKGVNIRQHTNYEGYISGLRFADGWSTLLGVPSLSNITIKHPDAQSESNQASVPSFDPSTLTYEVLLSSTHDDTKVPVVTGIAVSGVTISSVEQATSIDGIESDCTAKITVTKDGVDQVYKVKFTKSDSFIEGTLYGSTASPNATNPNPSSFIAVSGMYTRDLKSNGLFWGNSSYRASSSGEPYLMTPALAKGAGTVSFWLTEDDAGSDKTSELKVQYKRSADDDWITAGTITAGQLTTDVWVEKTVDVEVAESDVQIRLFIDRSGSQRDFRIDDIMITPYPVGTSVIDPSTNDNGSKIYYEDGKIFIIDENIDGHYVIYNILGKVVDTGVYSGNAIVDILNSGLYIVKTKQGSKKVLVN